MKSKEGSGKDTAEGTRGLQGTVLWMAPEVISRSQYSRGSDVWALACTIIEMANSVFPLLAIAPGPFPQGSRRPESHGHRESGGSASEIVKWRVQLRPFCSLPSFQEGS